MCSYSQAQAGLGTNPVHAPELPADCSITQTAASARQDLTLYWTMHSINSGLGLRLAVRTDIALSASCTNPRHATRTPEAMDSNPQPVEAAKLATVLQLSSADCLTVCVLQSTRISLHAAVLTCCSTNPVQAALTMHTAASPQKRVAQR